jgi:glycosyltransferase involved in cell wall biosynthesis
VAPPPRVYRVLPKRVREAAKDLLLVRSANRLRLAIEANPKPDVIINWITSGTSGAIDLGRHWGVPVVSIFDAPLAEEYQHLMGFPPFLSGLVDHHERRCVANSQALIVYSSAVRDHLASMRVHVPPLFRMAFTDFKRMDFAGFHPRDVRNFKFVYIGSFFNWHRVEDLVSAFETVSLRHADAQLLLVGDGPERGKIRAMTRNPNIVFAGRMDGLELDALLRQAHVGVIPNALWHQAPVKLFQYSAHGLAVISRETPTIRELTDGKSCYPLFRDRSGLEHLMEACLVAPELALKRGAEAQAHVRERFSPSSYATFFERVFASL